MLLSEHNFKQENYCGLGFLKLDTTQCFIKASVRRCLDRNRFDHRPDLPIVSETLSLDLLINFRDKMELNQPMVDLILV